MAELPDLSGKLYYTISEVSQICGVKPHVLRYWESEFPNLRPRKDRGGSRRYRHRDIEEVLSIRTLLHEEGYRIAGARKLLQQRKQGGEPVAAPAKQMAMPFTSLAPAQQLDEIRRELLEIRDLLRSPQARSREAKG